MYLQTVDRTSFSAMTRWGRVAAWRGQSRLPRDSSGGTRRHSRNHYKGLREGIFVRNRDVDICHTSGWRQLGEPRRGATCELHGWAAGRQIDNPHVAPPHAGAHTGAERLGTGFLGGEPLRVGLDTFRAAFGACALGLGEDAVE